MSIEKKVSGFLGMVIAMELEEKFFGSCHQEVCNGKDGG